MVDSTVITATNEQPTLEEQAASQEAAAQAASEAEPQLAGEEATPERPEWLPEKFKSVEDMAKAYKELEANASKPKETEGESETPEAPTEEAAEAVEAAGLDMSALSAEWETEGKLTDESYKALEAIGITPDMVELYAKGVETQTEATRSEMLAPVDGSQETYDEMIAWAADELPDADIDDFNKVLETGNTPAIKLAVQELATKFKTANGVEPVTTLSGSPAPTGASTYGSTTDLMKDMQNPEYAKNPAFRAKVEAKLARSNIM